MNEEKIVFLESDNEFLKKRLDEFRNTYLPIPETHQILEPQKNNLQEILIDNSNFQEEIKEKKEKIKNLEKQLKNYEEEKSSLSFHLEKAEKEKKDLQDRLENKRKKYDEVVLILEYERKEKIEILARNEELYHELKGCKDKLMCTKQKVNIFHKRIAFYFKNISISCQNEGLSTNVIDLSQELE